ncbi:RkpR, polysaccharide export protein [Rhizobium halophytocola]|uniref:Capsular polysaccharide transport system permease protein n=1 Tax=Rhizobium halophytocola TaxID=735519 RepID=A0ABS4E2X3_9HYPH|nr:RkpR, polysaccharide export protein [Rhizobium halophytocola]MBP1852299.1 capsular polysaccharide transport system permease protein [Rhizobium halophytocola]
MVESDKTAAKKPKPAEQNAKPHPHPNVRVLEGLLEKHKPQVRKKPKKRFQLRHWIIASGFVALVAVPTVASSLYMTFIAADQYQSVSSFSVRSIESSAMTSDIMGMFTQSASGGTVADSYILADYLLSEEMAKAVDAKFNLDKIYAPRGLDYFFGLSSGQPIELKTDYWQSMVSVNFDHSTGIIQLQVRAFDPVIAQEVATFVMKKSEELINKLSDTSRDESLKLANSELAIAEKRLSDARNALRSFRDTSQELDPLQGAKLAAELIAGMEKELVKLNADLATARQQMGEDTPRVRVMKTQISSLEKQIAQERQRFGAGSSDNASTGPDGLDEAVPGKIQAYEGLETEREFAEKFYTTSLAALEKARVSAASKQRYLAAFIQPTLSEISQYPSRLLDVILVFFGGLFAWAMLTLGYYNIRDRA